ncbi:hypothetical protein GQQ39_03690 [Klebsiella pneumoniae]|jgi:hypothetical protein|nr:hypothetical protein [Klebsiella pneumoniae]QHJ14719.1 hypothetical protein GO012_03390 [Klebsiella pneumoniae subsp. pneumoniae]BAH61588.1 hypothetical protein KP1_0744 [Klebsiella pneumoniae subsp. pneumoniae NTUH-K2044]MBW5585406.1 hypothetical protein [Klebsiella pneumoniae]MBW5590812.1 hypothetical protein [Klebsiella pneumoniae]
MLMIIFYALRRGLATGSECFVIGLTQYLHNNYLFVINQWIEYFSGKDWYFSGAETGCTWQD